MNDTAALIQKLLNMNLVSDDTLNVVQPSSEVRDSLFERIFPPEKVKSFLKTLPTANSRAIVVADPNGVTEWVSPAFSRMCGYSLAELRGKRTGSMLQGEKTDKKSVDTLRQAIQEKRSVKVNLINYHKLGARYFVEIELNPTFADTGELTGFIAVENEL